MRPKGHLYARCKDKSSMESLDIHFSVSSCFFLNYVLDLFKRQQDNHINLIAAWKRIHTILSQHKLNFAIHILIVDGFALLKINTSTHL